MANLKAVSSALGHDEQKQRHGHSLNHLICRTRGQVSLLACLIFVPSPPNPGVLGKTERSWETERDYKEQQRSGYVRAVEMGMETDNRRSIQRTPAMLGLGFDPQVGWAGGGALGTLRTCYIHNAVTRWNEEREHTRS